MRILVCGINYAPDFIGIAKYNTELCDALAAGGHEVRMVTAPPYYPEWKVSSDYRSWTYQLEYRNGVRIRRVPIFVPASPTGLNRLVHHTSFALSSAIPVISAAVRWRPDLMFSVAPSLMSSAAVAIAARLTGAASWLHVQDFEVDAAFDLGLLKKRRLRAPMLVVERRILHSFDRVSTIAPQMTQRLLYKGVNPHKLREIRNWVDTSVVTPGEAETTFRSELGLSQSDIVALYAGAMSNKQGLELIIEAARKIGQARSQIKFILCGEGPCKAQLVSMAAGCPNITFLPLQPDSRFPQLLRTADIHVIPQRAEAVDLVLPSKLGGMLASGRPVVAMAPPGSGLAQEVDEAGLVIAPGDADALANAVLSLSHDQALRQKLGGNARRRALAHWDKVSILGALERELVAFCGQDEQTGAPDVSPARVSSI